MCSGARVTRQREVRRKTSGLLQRLRGDALRDERYLRHRSTIRARRSTTSAASKTSTKARSRLELQRLGLDMLRGGRRRRTRAAASDPSWSVRAGGIRSRVATSSSPRRRSHRSVIRHHLPYGELNCSANRAASQGLRPARRRAEIAHTMSQRPTNPSVTALRLTGQRRSKRRWMTAGVAVRSTHV